MKPAITGIRLENPVVFGNTVQLGAKVEDVVLALAKFDVTEALTRGAGTTDALTCKPSEGSPPVESWVVDWSGNTPTPGTSFTVELWLSGQVTVTRSGAEDSLGGDRIVDLVTTSLSYPELVLGAGNVPSIQLRTYVKDTDFEFTFSGDRQSPRIKWKTTPPPLTEVTAFTWTLGETLTTYTRDVDWRVNGSTFEWLNAAGARPTASGTLAFETTRPFTYPVAYVKEAKANATRGTGTVDSLGSYPGVIRAVTVDGTKDGKAWSFLPDQDFSLYATQVRPEGVTTGAAYTFTGRATRKLVKGVDFTLGTTLVDGAEVSTLELLATPSDRSTMFVEATVRLRDAY